MDVPLGSQVVAQGRELRAERRQRVAVPLVLSLNGGDQRDDVLGHWLVGPELDGEVGGGEVELVAVDMQRALVGHLGRKAVKAGVDGDLNTSRFDGRGGAMAR